MTSEDTAGNSPVGLGVVGVGPDAVDGVRDELPRDGIELAAFCDEGLPNAGAHERPVDYYPDYNVMLRQEAVDLVLVDGPVELRRDFAVRALNAGKHALLRPPFCETAVDAERVMKTALRSGLVATMDVDWGDDPDLLALQEAVSGENAAGVYGAFCFWPAPEPVETPMIEMPDLLAAMADDEPDLLEPDTRVDVSPDGALSRTGMGLLYRVRMLVREDIKSVSAHLQQPVSGSPDRSYMLYIALRNGGWVVVQCSRHLGTGLPRWVLHSRNVTFTALDGVAAARTDGEERRYAAPEKVQGFWTNLLAAVRGDADPKCHPADIVRAMKLHEAAIASAEVGEAVVL